MSYVAIVDTVSMIQMIPMCPGMEERWSFSTRRCYFFLATGYSALYPPLSQPCPSLSNLRQEHAVAGLQLSKLTLAHIIRLFAPFSTAAAFPYPSSLLPNPIYPPPHVQY